MAETTAELGRLKSRLGQARRAWKRNAALSGLVVVVSETAGVVGVAVLADVLFAPERAGRMLLLGGAVAVTAYLTARHIVTPLFRSISDSNLALYLEERTPAFEGALIAAVEFGDEQALPPQQARIVHSILLEAVARVERFDLRKALDFRRFRKYGVVAMLLLGAYVTLTVAMPETIGKHVARVVAPWKPTAEELEARQRQAELGKPVTFTLSRQDTSLLRGSAFDLEATLSRKPEDAVYFHFRAYDAKSDSAAWKQLPMKQAERLNGFDFVLPDVNEELEFFVSSGAHKSQAYRISVHDPLAIVDTKVTIHYPDYLKREDETTQVASPDVSALVGSTATIRFEANLPIKGGTLTWGQGSEKPVTFTVAKDNPLVATASFEVKADAVYEYRLVDTNGQELQSPGPLTVRALPDKPPSIKLLTPEPMVSSHPLGEVAFSSEVSDDYGLAGVELVYYRGVDPAAPATRLPVKVDAGRGAGPLMLESLLPQVQPGDMLTCFMECTDLKGQKAVSDLVLLTVKPFDTWATWAPPEEMGGGSRAVLTAVLQATWSLHAQKAQLPPAQFDKQSEELADSMVDKATNALLQYVMLEELKGEALEHGKKAVALIERGHGDLKQHSTSQAIGDFRAALGEMAAAGLQDVVQLPPPPPANSAAAVAQNMENLDVKAESQAAMAPAPAPAAKPEQEQASANAAAELASQQQTLAEKLKQQAKEAGTAAQQQNQQNAAEQKGLAGKAQAAAEQLKAANAPKAADQMAGAARTMHEAAKALDAGDREKATQKAEEAVKELSRVVAEIKGQTQDQIGKLLDEAERAAQQARQEQAENRQKTEAVAEALGGKAPDARQQRQIKEAAANQAKLTAKVEGVAQLLEQLKQIGANGQMKAETAKQVEEAALAMKRSRAAQKVANAAVELAAGHPENAAPEQQKAEAGLGKVLEAVRAANDARATGHEAELKRAKGEAERIKEAVASAGAKDASAAAKKEAAARATDEAQRLARHLNQRDLFKGDAAAQQDAKRLEELMASAPAVQAQLETQQQASEFAKVTARLQNRLEAEYQSMLAAKNLFSSQREECPPEYRQLVNQYFEALSNRKQ